MAYRTGTYVAFNGCGTTDPTASDRKYFEMLKAWSASKNVDFNLNDSHDKTSSVNDSSSLKTLKDRLMERMRKSKNMLVIISEVSNQDRGLLPFEIENGVDTYGMPVIMAYTDGYGDDPLKKHKLWPKSLKNRIDSKAVKTIHVPFKLENIKQAVETYGVNNMPRNHITKL
ncbi:hypothetical protein HNP86_001729 [Methanococcus maripaludis]|uniref:Thoeris protein ThsB TIR-like domain-containing protein n=1 Tax=Methanococcus maripaludis TaxID=39152 RepID=A0A7J9P0L4_METMI|nr:TIR domain-containing protein [Methanococcus maripaludis]MBA2851576.1 hypothetical protein [Methanococcus maripaludis]